MKKIGIPVIVLLLGFCVFGCVSADATYHDFGDISDANYALIQVNPIYDGGNVWQFINFVKINDHGNTNIWRSYIHSFNHVPQSIVRVPPGEYTFTITFIRSIQNALSRTITRREIPVNITYHVKAGKGYRFRFSTTCDAPGSAAPTFAEIVILEGDMEKISTLFYSYTEVARRTVRFDMTTADLGL